MTKLKIIIPVLLLAVSYSFLSAQPVLTGIVENSTIKTFLRINPGYLNKSRTADTLNLPFFDDFSRPTIFPNEDFWIDNFAFINTTFPDNPPSLGAATLDRLDENGEIYSHANSTSFIADYLTSKPINLHGLETPNTNTYLSNLLFYYNDQDSLYYPGDSLWYYDTGSSSFQNAAGSPYTYSPGDVVFYLQMPDSIYYDVSSSLYYYDGGSSSYVLITAILELPYLPADSIYLSFLYQPQGLSGNDPEFKDSLVLEFRTPSSPWKSVWRVAGKENTEFVHAIISITNTEYLVKGFQFRFRNYSSLGDPNTYSWHSNGDIWNIDYVYLNTGRTYKDTCYKDVTFVHDIPPLLNNYYSMPWPHFKANNSEMNNFLELYCKNIGLDSINTNTFYQVNNLIEGIPGSVASVGTENLYPFHDITFTKLIPTFPNNSSDSALFEIKTFISSDDTTDLYYNYRINDTMSYYQKFYNYYALDDGSAENGLGLYGAGSENGMIAMQYYTYVTDTLKGVQIFFNHTKEEENLRYFYLTLWNNDDGKPGDVIYSQIGVLALYNGNNHFNNYLFDTLLIVSDTFYVGWVKTNTIEMMNVGLDCNSNNQDKTFYSMNGTAWYNSPYTGTPMIRPVLGKEIVSSAGKIDKYVDEEISLYPNPAESLIEIDFRNGQPAVFNVHIYDSRGRLSGEYNNSSSINVSGFNSGIYFIRITAEGRYISTGKFIIAR